MGVTTAHLKHAFLHSALCRAIELSVLAIVMLTMVWNSLAQCPDDNTPDPGPPWISEGCKDVPLPNTNCRATICYCDRWNVTIPEWETYITSVTPDAGDTCNDPEVLFKGAIIYFEDQGRAGEDVTIPPCGGAGIIIKTYLPQCWSVTYNSGIPTYTSCPDGISCTATCTECWNGTEDVLTGCTLTGSYVPGLCAKPIAWPWPSDGTCWDGGNMCGPN